MKRIVLSCVGNRDPFALEGVKSFDEKAEEFWNNTFDNKKIEGPILGFAKKIDLTKTDQVILFYTKAGKNVLTPTEKGALATKKVLCDQFGLEQENVQAISLNEPRIDPDFNPSETEAALNNMRKALQSVLSGQADEDCETWIIYDPGTPQMQTAWFLLVNSGFLNARLFRARDTREIQIEPLFEDQLLKEACNLLKNGIFKAVAEIFDSLGKRAVLNERRGIFRILATLSSAYHWWNGFEYQKALEEIKHAVKSLEGLQKTSRLKSLPPEIQIDIARFQNFLSKQQDFLEEVTKSIELRLADIFENANRQYEQENYHEVVWKLDVLSDFVFIEGALQAIENQFRVRLNAEDFYSEVDSENDPGLKNFIDSIKQPTIPYSDLRASEAKKILRRIASSQINDIVDGFYNTNLAKTRNAAIHYAQPIEKGKVYRSLSESRNFVEEIFNKNIITDFNHPLSKQHIEELAELFQKIGAGII